VAQLVQEELSRLLVRDMSDPNLALVNVTDVTVTPDLRSARVYYSTLEERDLRSIQRSLEHATSLFQRRIAEAIRLRHTPVLSFHFDPSSKEASLINGLVDELKRERESRQQEETAEEALGRAVAEAKSVLLCTHVRPDGDAVGSLLAVRKAIASTGSTVIACCPDGIPGYLRFLPGADLVVQEFPENFAPELTIVLDTASTVQLPTGFDRMSAGSRVVVIDHHMNFEQFGDLVIREDVSATGELLWRLFRTLLWPIDTEIATCLYTAVAADTGAFRQPNTRPSTLRVAAEMQEEGADVAVAIDHLFGLFPAVRQILLGKVLSTLVMHDNNRIAVLSCTDDMMASCGAQPSHLEGFINFARDIEGVEVAILAVAHKDSVKLGLRSGGRVDVAAIAARFGGGGHVGAAGATVQDSLESVIRNAIGETRRVLSSLS